MDEKQAIRLCLAHQDPIGFEFLVKKYRREAYFHAMSFMGNAEDAADACQESFTRAFTAISRLTHLDAFYPWFYRILKNCCLNMISKKKTVRKHQSKVKTDHYETTGSEDPLSLVEGKEEQKQIWAVLESLNPESREILVMKYIQGYCYDEIARMLAVPRGTVMSRLYYARKAFREVYLKEVEDVAKKG